MQNVDFSPCYSEVCYEYGRNPIRDYIEQELNDMQFSTLRQVVDHLQSAACAHGSWSGVIYNRDIEEKLNCPRWRLAIEEALAEYEDVTGEQYCFNEFSQALWFAIEFEAQRFAMYFEHAELARVVTLAVDSCDPNPERIAFLDCQEADDFAAEEITRRVDFIVQHSPEALSEEEVEQLHELEAQLVTVEEAY
jgi:hypothetical protein